MKIAIYIDINDKDYEKYDLKRVITNYVKHILTDIKSKALFIEHPIMYKDDISIQTIIKEK